MKVFVTLLTGIQGQREGVYEVNRDFFKTAATAGGCIRHPTNVDQLVVNMNREVRVDIGRVFDALPPLQPPRAPAFEKRVPPLLLPSSQQLVFIVFCRNF